MPLYDLDHGGTQLDEASFYKKFLLPTVKLLDPRTFTKMVQTVDTELFKLKPSVKSQLTWTKCAALCGYQSDAPTHATNHLWKYAEVANRFNTDGCNLFVGSLIMWRIALLTDKWVSVKTLDKDKVHPYRTYWINDTFVPPGQGPTVHDLMNKFNQRGSHELR